MHWQTSDGIKYCIVKFADDDPEVMMKVKYEFMKKYYPNDVIKYFEKNIEWRIPEER